MVSGDIPKGRPFPHRVKGTDVSQLFCLVYITLVFIIRPVYVMAFHIKDKPFLHLLIGRMIPCGISFDGIIGQTKF